MRMPRTPVLALAAALSLWAVPASAQFANKSLGLDVGYFDLNNADRLENGFPIGLFGSLYIENGFDAVAHFQFMILNDQLAGGRRQVVGVAPSVGLRYLFSEEGLRPYAGLDLSFLLTFREVGIRSYFGLGPNIGLDYFLSDTFSIGVRGQYNLYVALNTPLQTAIGAQLVLATYF